MRYSWIWECMIQWNLGYKPLGSRSLCIIAVCKFNPLKYRRWPLSMSWQRSWINSWHFWFGIQQITMNNVKTCNWTFHIANLTTRHGPLVFLKWSPNKIIIRRWDLFISLQRSWYDELFGWNAEDNNEF